jgi:trehalose 6-phosphate synthase
MVTLKNKNDVTPPNTGWRRRAVSRLLEDMRIQSADSTTTRSAVRPGEPDACGSWTAERLDGWLRSYEREPMIVVAHRDPGTAGEGTSRLASPASSSLASAVEPLMRACSGVWLAHDDGFTTTSAAAAEEPFRIRRLSPENDDERARYSGFANEALWPLCHRAHVKPSFRVNDFTAYWRVNAQFADAVCEEARSDSPLVLVHDFHFALAPLFVRERLPLSRVITFWPIPWPDWQAFDICPWRRYLLEGLLGSSIIGFQTPLDCRNFVETIERCLGAHVDRHQEAIAYDGRHVLVRPYPMSVRWPGWWASCSPDVDVCRGSIRRQLRLPADVRLGVGVDRLDLTKGLEEKLMAIERVLDSYPEHRGKLVFTQLASPSPEAFPGSCELRLRLRALRDRINDRFGNGDYTPVILIEGDTAPSHVNMFLRAADFCYVGSLHDGMNLVAKEFVAARDDESGVLVLSTFAGAARELTDALTINPYDTDEAAAVLSQALAMTADEQRDRMRRMRSVVAEFSAWRWAAQILSDAARLRKER